MPTNEIRVGRCEKGIFLLGQICVDDVLIVSANERIHEDVREFLEKLERAFEKHKAKR